MKLKQICKWISEIVDEEPNQFSDYFIYDVFLYLQIEDIEENNLEIILKDLCGPKFIGLKNCNSKDDVRKWLNNITNFIIRKIDVNIIIDDYFSF